MDGFLKWFFEFMTAMLGGFATIFAGIFSGIKQIFNFPAYVNIFNEGTKSFTTVDWVMAVLALLVVLAVWGLAGYGVFLLIKRSIRMRRSLSKQELMFEEISNLNRQVNALNDEKSRILEMKLGKGALRSHVIDIDSEEVPEGEEKKEPDEIVSGGDPRFFKLAQIDQQYTGYVPEPDHYVTGLSLQELCDSIRNFACSQMKLYYNIDTIRYMIAGMASTKLILLQGISGTGKTSLPYCMGKFFTHDSTIASVQPSWRDRTELFGYFNEFTKKFNETEVLKRIYEASYTDDMNIIILDEMNIARVEYYFAEMLSTLEMPDHREWKIDLVPNSWGNDPKHLRNGQLHIPENMWYIGTANNDDSTFAVSDKVYDRALVINLDSKGEAFEAPEVQAMNISYSYFDQICKQAIKDHQVSPEMLTKIAKLDIYIIEKLRLAFGNRIMKQLRDFVPVFVASGGDELEGVDYILATKVFRKIESLNLSLIRDELKDLNIYIQKSFGKNSMKECRAYIERLQKMF